MAKKQGDLPGVPVGTSEVPEQLKPLLIEYKRAQRNRMRHLAKEIELKNKIISQMVAAKVRHLLDEDDDIEVELVAGKDRLKVSTPSEQTDDEPQEE